MATNAINNTRVVRREELFQDDLSRVDGNPVNDTESGGEGEDEETAAARAALDAYMKEMLSLRFDISSPYSVSKPVQNPNEKQEGDRVRNDEGGGNENDEESDNDSDESDVDVESSYGCDGGDDETTGKSAKTGKRKRSKQDSKVSPAALHAATEFAFRLLSSSRKATCNTTTAKSQSAHSFAPIEAPVVLLDDISGDGDGLGRAPGSLSFSGALLSEPRPLSYYIVSKLHDDARNRYAQVAVSGEDLLAQADPACRNAWGFEVPWRARTVINVAGKAALRALLANALPEGKCQLPTSLSAAMSLAANALPKWACEPSTWQLETHLPGPSENYQRSLPRGRPGKKRRIILRQREKLRREKEATAAALEQSKEEQLLEKKKRLNRAKKLRRRKKRRAVKGDDAGNDSESGRDSSID